MFNYSSTAILFFTIFIYILQLITFLCCLLLISKNIGGGLSTTNLVFTNKNVKYLFMVLILSYAGMPPFFLFFFKILILLKLNSYTWLLTLFITVNSIVLFYYINFLSKLKFAKQPSFFNFNLNIQVLSVSLLTHIALFNVCSIFFVPYIFLNFTCLTDQHN